MASPSPGAGVAAGHLPGAQHRAAVGGRRAQPLGGGAGVLHHRAGPDGQRDAGARAAPRPAAPRARAGAGMVACGCVQKWRMPVRLSAISVRKPETSSSAMKVQPAGARRSARVEQARQHRELADEARQRRQARPAAACSRRSSGRGRPRRRESRGRRAPAASSSRFTSSSGCRSSARKGASPAASCGAMLMPALRQRSIMSISRKKALAASVELSR